MPGSHWTSAPVRASGSRPCEGTTLYLETLNVNPTDDLCQLSQAELRSVPGSVRPFDAVLVARWCPGEHDLGALPALLKPGGVALVAADPGHEQARSLSLHVRSLNVSGTLSRPMRQLGNLCTPHLGATRQCLRP